MVDLTDGHAIETDLAKPSDTAKLAMFGLTSGGVRFIIMEHPSNKQLAYVDIDVHLQRQSAQRPDLRGSSLAPGQSRYRLRVGAEPS